MNKKYAALIVVVCAMLALPAVSGQIVYARALGSASCTTLTYTCTWNPTGSHGSLVPAEGAGTLYWDGAVVDVCNFSLLDSSCGTSFSVSGPYTHGGLCVHQSFATTVATTGAAADSTCWIG